MTEIGNSLREARIRRGLTIRDVEDATKIRGRYLQALEEDDFETIPSPVYVKAFLRTYAAFLKLDADSLVEEYKQRHEPGPEKGDKEVRRSSSSSSSVRRRTERRQSNRSTRRPRGYFAVGLLAVVAVALLAWFGSNWRGEEKSPLEEATFTSLSTAGGTGGVVSGSQTTVASRANTSTGSSSTSATTSVSQPVSASGNVVLVISVTQGSCWMVVREDNESGAELYAGTLAAGGEQTFDQAKAYWLHVGEPGSLALLVNGVPFTLDPGHYFYLVTGAGVRAAE